VRHAPAVHELHHDAAGGGVHGLVGPTSLPMLP
jgi:hypothetical protein